MEASVASIAVEDDVKPYKIHVSSKYLELTKKKLELTRLPHELLLPPSREWEAGTPKSAIEPLIDFWLENYEWRAQESLFNATLSQFRAAIVPPSSSTPLRIHFIHLKSPHSNALPLLLLPSFPLTNLSLTALFKLLTDPDTPQNTQPYHLVIPSIPGLGFSDAFNSPEGTASSLKDTASIFNSLMLKLDYQHYIASSTGSGLWSPANIDYHLPRLLASNHSNNCLGIHIIDPPIQAPTISTPWNWTKYTVARFFHAPIFGYTSEDWEAFTATLQRSKKQLDVESGPSETSHAMRSKSMLSQLRKGVNTSRVAGLLGLHEPNTLAYALTDSPVGLLSLVLKGLRQISPDHQLSQTEIINMTQLAWLPGPEGAMRYWSTADHGISKKIKYSNTPTAVTVFLGESEANGGIYRFPTWAETRHQVVWTKRQSGRGGLIAMQRMGTVVEGIRGLTDILLKTDARLKASPLAAVVVTDNEPMPVVPEVSTSSDAGDPEEQSSIQFNFDDASPDTVVEAPRI